MSLRAALFGDVDGFGALGALNVVCPPADCQVGQSQMSQAVDWWNTQASATTQARFGSALKVITDRRQAILDRYTAGSTLPTSECCELADLGRQAAQLTKDMATADSKAPPPSLEPPPSPIANLVTLLAVGAVAVAVALVARPRAAAAPAVRSNPRRRRRRSKRFLTRTVH